MTRLDRFDIAASRTERPATRFPSNVNAGWPPFAAVDGSIGYEILKQFIITFDYPHRELWLERSSAFGTKTIQGTTGFQAIKFDRSGFRVVTVLPKTPATAAGIIVGDLITEVDSLPAGSMSQAEFGDTMQRPDGTVVQLQIVRDDSTRPITLALKELLP
jgi:C-terminal processing protease CtpA/Prc